ncbi:phosphatidylserine synthase 1-like [Asterias rubens]|uniref:phosphatidylserine synthase 1-like n=1 Tax=Asterias rubens TaxID=7604 RepID=UPI001455B5AB|nr:phosphatidylserine synthase 1-like [Asterias rubens]
MAISRRGHRRLSASEMSDHFRLINEQSVEDINLEFFYKPHTLTLLLAALIATVYFAFTKTSDTSNDGNIRNGLCCVVFFFLLISLLAFPNGPFTRPHPALWRVVFGVSVMYLLLLVFILFQNYQDIRRIMVWFFPDLEAQQPTEKSYAVNCSDITFERVWGHLDWFAFSHFFGWIVKAMMIRHWGILWTLSFTWELTEFAFIHLLPNFAECWWDSLVLDFLLCNGAGICLGLFLCKKLEIKNFHWDSIRDIRSTSGKIRRAMLQFTPASWTEVRWLDPQSSYMRVIAVFIMILFTQLVELNTFFSKHIFLFAPDHPLCVIRICLVCSMVAPVLRQYHSYVTDPACKRVGTQLWVFAAITVIESLICVKSAIDLFAQTIIFNVVLWLLAQMLMVVICLYGIVLQTRKEGHTDRSRNTKKRTENSYIEEVNGLSSNSEQSSGATHRYNTRRRISAAGGDLN